MNTAIIVAITIVFFGRKLYLMLVEFIRGAFKTFEDFHEPYTPLVLRKYNIDLFHDDDEDIFTVSEWENNIKNISVRTTDGCGYWVKNGKRSVDEVFCTPRLDATHVVWYNK